MNWLSLETAAQISAGRILNSLPEGILIAIFAWSLLRILRRQNSGTRFAIWFLALLTVAGLPLAAILREWISQAGMLSGTSWGSRHPAFTIPASWSLFVFAAWAAGASIGLARLAAGLWQLRRLNRTCTAIVTSDLDLILQKTIATIKASGATVVTSDAVRVPAAIGFGKRVIVLPAWTLREMPVEDLNVILLHEFAHLQRRDDWTNLVQKIVRALFFFHPAVWWIESRLSVEREMACDDAVLAKTANPQGYATCLLSLLEKSMAHRGWSMAQAAVHRAHEASLRLAQILDRNRPSATRVWKPALAVTGVFSIMCLVTLSQAPQFIAFDSVEQGTLAGIRSDSVAANVAPMSASPSASVVPAAFRTGDGPAANTARKAPVRVAVHPAESELAPARAIAARLNDAQLRPAQPDGRMVMASASVDDEQEDEQKLVPEFQTLVFVQATQYGGANSPSWHVQVWRVTLVGTPRVGAFAIGRINNRIVEVPIVDSI